LSKEETKECNKLVFDKEKGNLTPLPSAPVYPNHAVLTKDEVCDGNSLDSGKIYEIRLEEDSDGIIACDNGQNGPTVPGGSSLLCNGITIKGRDNGLIGVALEDDVVGVTLEDDAKVIDCIVEGFPRGNFEVTGSGGAVLADSTSINNISYGVVVKVNQ
jgi:hypothetical protein